MENDMNKNIHVKKRASSCWIVFGEGDKNIFSIHSNRNTAVQVATTIAKNLHSEVIIHNRNGRETRKSPVVRLNTIL
jgi:Uncharacterized protein conserved in bacteria (DUF2188)